MSRALISASDLCLRMPTIRSHTTHIRTHSLGNALYIP